MLNYIKDLSDPSAYPEKPPNITVVHTHISTVFIGDEIVYKIKKPVNFGFLDFSTLEKRHHFCDKENELNRRLAQDVYLGVFPVTFDGLKYRIDGTGEIVDYAVKMRRLPEEELLKLRFSKSRVSSDDIERLSQAIAEFHKKSERTKIIDQYGEIEAVKFNTDENFQQTGEFIGKSISQKQFNEIKLWTNNFYQIKPELFKNRIEKGRIRDCHGDLHMEHIYLTDPIIIYDCIEFNDRIRYSDIFADIAFLLMDLEFNKGEKLSKLLCKSYLSNMDEEDETTFPLINFYKIYRAYVRGKVVSFMLNDENISDEKKDAVRKNAQQYFSLAHSYITQKYDEVDNYGM
jgi:aminoglycoside phosphotransferase family enzyme